MTTPRSASALLAAAAVVVAVATGAGCSANPSSPPPPATSTAPATSTSSSAVAAFLDLVSPCGFLTEAQAGMFGYAQKSERDPGNGGDRSCTYTEAGNPRQLTIAITTTSLSDLRPTGADTVAREKIGKHDAMRLQSGTDALCSVYLDASGQSVLVQAAKQESSQQACVHAMTVATNVERGLPQPAA